MGGPWIISLGAALGGDFRHFFFAFLALFFFAVFAFFLAFFAMKPSIDCGGITTCDSLLFDQAYPARNPRFYGGFDPRIRFAVETRDCNP